MSSVKARTYRGPRVAVKLVCEEPSLAVQASKEECDINVIVKKYMRTGELPGVRQAIYADISHYTNLQDALHQVAAAEEGFMSLPAEVRRYFDNDPVKLIEFAQDPANNAKAIELGLAEPKPQPPRQPAPAPAPAAGGAPVPPPPPVL